MDSQFSDIFGHGASEAELKVRLMRQDTAYLSEQDLLRLILTRCIKEADIVSLVAQLLDRFGSYAATISAPLRDLLCLAGMNESAGIAFKLIQVAAQRLLKEEICSSPILSDFKSLFGYLHAVMAREEIEQTRLLFLDTNRRLLEDEVHARGTIDFVAIYPREILKRALELQAAGVIIVHNHPSGDPTPSKDDVGMTIELRKIARFLSVEVHDHLVIGNGRCFSFRQHGLL